jgi:hypothetical protein
MDKHPDGFSLGAGKGKIPPAPVTTAIPQEQNRVHGD